MLVDDFDLYVPTLQNILTEDDLANTIALFDYDLTLAKKPDPKNTDFAALSVEQYLGLQRLAPKLRRLVILTARGETSVLKYLREHEKHCGRIQNLTLASNSGHWVHELDKPRPVKVEILPIKGLETEVLRTQVIASIHSLVSHLNGFMPRLTADIRELCGAVVYQIHAHPSSPNRFKQAQILHNEADAFLKTLSPEVAAQIKFSKKSWVNKDNPDLLQGYIDVIPAGMSKGDTARALYNRYRAGTRKDKAWVAGDSAADGDMMIELFALVPPSHRLFVSVGDGLVGLDDNWAAQHNGQRLLNCIFTGSGAHDVAIDQMHRMIGHFGGRQTSLDHRNRQEPLPEYRIA